MRPEVAKPETDASREFVERADSRFRFPFGLSQPRKSEALGGVGHFRLPGRPSSSPSEVPCERAPQKRGLERVTLLAQRRLINYLLVLQY